MSETPTRIGSGFDDAPDGELDPELAPPAQSERVTTLDSLREELAKQLVKDVEFVPLTLEVEARPGVSLTYATNLDDEQLTNFRKKAKRKDHPDGVDVHRLYCIVLAHLCQSVNMHGEQVTGDDGNVWSPKHPEVKDLFGIPRAGTASTVVNKIIGKDAHVLVHGNAVMQACGYGDEANAMEEGPTHTS